MWVSAGTSGLFSLNWGEIHVLGLPLSIAVPQTKEEIAREVQDELSKAFAAFGYEILQALVTDIDPDPRVKAAMNEVGAVCLYMHWMCVQRRSHSARTIFSSLC